MISYKEQLKLPKWQMRRLKILERDGCACQYCGDTETELHIHHEYYEYGKKVWEYPDEALKTLCKVCHHYIETLKPLKDELEIISISKIPDNKENIHCAIIKYMADGRIAASLFEYKNGDFKNLILLTDVGATALIGILNSVPSL
jgi:hypothetical protein